MASLGSSGRNFMEGVPGLIIKIKINDALGYFRLIRDCFKDIVPPGNRNTKTGVRIFAVMINVIAGQFPEYSLTQFYMQDAVHEEIAANSNTGSGDKSEIVLQQDC